MSSSSQFFSSSASKADNSELAALSPIQLRMLILELQNSNKNLMKMINFYKVWLVRARFTQELDVLPYHLFLGDEFSNETVTKLPREQLIHHAQQLETENINLRKEFKDHADNLNARQSERLMQNHVRQSELFKQQNQFHPAAQNTQAAAPGPRAHETNPAPASFPALIPSPLFQSNGP